jgi:hypothetical protein
VVFTSKGKNSTKKLTASVIAFIVYISASFDPIFKISFAVENFNNKLLFAWNENLNFCKRHFETALKPLLLVKAL